MPSNPVNRRQVIHPSKALPAITAGIIVGVFVFVSLICGLIFWCARQHEYREGETIGPRAVEEVRVEGAGRSHMILVRQEYKPKDYMLMGMGRTNKWEWKLYWLIQQ